MFRFCGRSLKYIAAGLVVLGVAGALIGPRRIQNLFRYVQSTATENIDGMIPDEVKLKNDMEKLREEYPRRIAELESMLDDLDRQLAQIERDRGLCREVLTLCQEDMGQLGPRIKNVETAHPTSATTIEFRGVSFTYPEALERSRKILDIREMYETRLKTGSESAGLLQTERDGLLADLSGLRKEYDQFLAEYRSLAREIDLIRHNERILEIANHRNRLDRLDASGWISSLDAFKKAIERCKTEQREKLRGFRLGSPVDEYETRARIREL